MKKVLLSCILLVTLSPFYLFAESNLTGQIDYTPTDPKPFETVKLSLVSYSFDPDGSDITWYVNKVVVKKGKGEKNISFLLGEANKTFFIGADVITPAGEKFQTSIALTPHFTPLLTESVEGYTPPFYEGRSLYAEGAKVKVVAFPVVTENGKSLSKKDLIYKWSVNSVPFSSASGLGKNSFIVRQDELEEENVVSLTASSPSGASNLSERVSVRPYEITPLFYLYDPLYGVDYSTGYVNDISITKPVKLFYAPYNFSYTKTASYFNWTLEGLPIVTDSDFLITLIPKEGSRGDSTIRLTANNDKKMLQNLDSTLVVHFDTNDNATLKK